MREKVNFFYHNSSLFCLVSETKIKDHFVLHTNVPQISGKYDLRNHFWPLESASHAKIFVDMTVHRAMGHGGGSGVIVYSVFTYE